MAGVKTTGYSYKNHTRLASANKYTLFTVLIILMSVFFNQSNVVFGVNISVSDLFACFIIFIISVKKRLSIPIKEVLFFVLLSMNVIFTSTILVPLMTGYHTNESFVLRDYLKLLVLFVYFLIGFNCSKMKYTKIMIKYFSIGTFIMSVISIFYSVFRISAYRDTLFFGGNRFRGLMNDPNYFSVLQLTGMVYFLRNKEMSNAVRIYAILAFVFSIVLSGSKTGFVSLLIYLGYYYLTIYVTRNTVKELYKRIALFVLAVILFLLIYKFSDVLISLITKYVPTTERVFNIFSDFNSAISENGSSRAEVWALAYKLIQQFPLLGIGVGTYLGLSRYLYGYGNVAHNSYLQLMTEWGMVFTIVFLFYLFKNLYNSTKKFEEKLDSLILRDIIMIFLIGSLAISLNNARFFWLVLGIIAKNNKILQGYKSRK